MGVKNKLFQNHIFLDFFFKLYYALLENVNIVTCNHKSINPSLFMALGGHIFSVTFQYSFPSARIHYIIFTEKKISFKVSIEERSL